MKRTIVAMAAAFIAAVALAADPYPAGSIAFFNTSDCPAGWSFYTGLIGRTVLPEAPQLAGSLSFGDLPSGGEPSHTHPFNASVKLKSVSYALLSGGGNEGLTTSGTKEATGTTEAQSGNIPYVQLLPCRKNDAPAESQKPPPNVLVFTANQSGCNSGWINATRLNGRFIAGLPTGGTAEASFGPALPSGFFAPNHTHAISPIVDFKSYGVLALKGGTGGYGERGKQTVTGKTNDGQVWFPYVRLVACQGQ
jgi:hypothetical protein